MKLKLQTINKSLNPAYRLLKAKRVEMEHFKQALKTYLHVINSQETEENLKTHLMDFLKKLYGKEYLIEQQERIDFVIRNGGKGTNAGVLFESKKHSNTQDMITKEAINKKALHELVLYFMRERQLNNTDIKFLVICSEYEFYVFEAKEFERSFFKSASFKKDFVEWSEGKKSDKTTDFFYNSIAKPFIESSEAELTATHFDLRKFQKALLNDESSDDTALIPLLKVFSPEHLLKTSFANDSNSLNKAFYDELLHIIGLFEEKDGSACLIKRLAEKDRNPASLLENTISKLKREDDFNSSEWRLLYGDNNEERAFSMALELCITWVNRLLFLKLLESQIVKYQCGNKAYRFLNSEFIEDYDDLADLFFGVLALKPNEREDHIREKFAKVPYLNSSLFEKTSLEKIVGVSQLNHSFDLPLHKNTVLRDEQNRPLKKSLKTLDYIFQFLDAYDFASEGSEEIQEESKSIINASVLGLIFEKINGYKDGSIFTPGYITMYMSQKVIEKTVIEKFQEAQPNWKIASLDDLKNYLSDHRSKEDIKRFNTLINSIRICDPAVGSGHFLVSCLNELIAIKSRLGLLADANGNRISDYEVHVDNDEIIITHVETSEIFTYQVVGGAVPKRMQQVQQILFNEKQTLIEGCLFGVDINPNSVKICRLRLWIELLKNAYYQEEGGFKELETLPNIDINIKQGNSLLSRFRLDQNLSDAFNKADLTVADYKQLVNDYKTTKNRQTKRELLKKIDAVKSRFKNEVLGELDKKIEKQIREFQALEAQEDLFVLEGAVKKSQKEKLKSYQEEIAKLKARREAYQANATFLGALEWRFEFPEVLDDSGKYVGFDIIIANPPYMRVQQIQDTQPLQKPIYEANYSTAKGSYDLANLFFELAVRLASAKSNNIYIFPHKFFNSDNGSSLREYLMNSKTMKHIAHFGANMVFDNATTYTCIAMFNKQESNGFRFQRFKYGSDFKSDLLSEDKYSYLTYENIKRASEVYGSNQWIFFDEQYGYEIFEKIYRDSQPVSSVFEIFVGLQTSRDTLYVAKKLSETDSTYTIKINPEEKQEKPLPVESKTFEVEKRFFKPFLMGKDVHRYDYLETDRLVFFPYKLDGKAELVTLDELASQYPLTHAYVMYYQANFKKRENGKAAKMVNIKEAAGGKIKTPAWHGYIYPKSLDRFDQIRLSSMELCSVHPNVTVNDSIYHSTTVYSWVKNHTNNIPYAFYAAIINSTLFWWFLKHTGDTLSSDTRRMKTNYLNPFPLPLNVSKKQQDGLTEMVTNLMALKRSGEQPDQIQALEEQIDEAVFSLYGLNDDDKASIRESLKSPKASQVEDLNT